MTRSSPVAVDLAQSAVGMVRSYGERAEHEATARAVKFQKANDQRGFDTWSAIAVAIRQAASNQESSLASKAAE